MHRDVNGALNIARAFVALDATGALPDHMRRDVDHAAADEADATTAFVLRHEAQEGRCVPHGDGREAYFAAGGAAGGGGVRGGR